MANTIKSILRFECSSMEDIVVKRPLEEDKLAVNSVKEPFCEEKILFGCEDVTLTYLFMICWRSCGSFSRLTDRSEMETVTVAVRVTRSTRDPLSSSSSSSSLCVFSLLNLDRSSRHLRYVKNMHFL